jgi:hypothetical protein
MFLSHTAISKMVKVQQLYGFIGLVLATNLEIGLRVNFICLTKFI